MKGRQQQNKKYECDCQGFVPSNVGEVLEFHITTYKKDGFLPEHFRLSNDARNYLKHEADNILKQGRKYHDSDVLNEIVEHTIFGFCMGYHIKGRA